MKTVAIVQARMGSQRLPGKVMMEVRNKPLIGYLLDRLEKAHFLAGIIVAIPARDYDTPLARYIEGRKIALFAGGAEMDLCERFLGVLDSYPCDAFVRVCADSPLIDPLLVDQIALGIRNTPSGFLSNAGLKIIPHGQYLEACTVPLYRQICDDCEREDREHAGFPYIYRLIDRARMTVDTPDDFEKIKRLIENMEYDHTNYSWEQCAAWLQH